MPRVLVRAVVFSPTYRGPSSSVPSPHCHYCTASAPKHTEGVLMRSYFADHLFRREQSFFSRSAPVTSTGPLAFNEFLGENAYRKALAKEYARIDGFLTPVEIFKPHYSYAIANYILKNAERLGYRSGEPFHLCEIGGGTGNNMALVLDYLKKTNENFYETVNVTMIDASAPFVKVQEQTLTNHTEKVRVVNKSAFEWSEKVSSPGLVLALELLDNLPHDKLTYDAQSGALFESRVLVKDGTEVEIRVPVQDEFILHHLRALALKSGLITDTSFDARRLAKSPFSHAVVDVLRFSPPPSLFGRMIKALKSALPAPTPNAPEVFYISTGAHRLLQVLARSFPRHGLLLADFTSLEETMPGHNGPLIQATKGSKTTVKPTYLNAERGSYDVLFPTNFRYLTALHATVNPGHRRSVLSQADFLSQHCPTVAESRTRSGYNPLLSDFINTAVFISQVNKAST